jgi:hypothetical protein
VKQPLKFSKCGGVLWRKDMVVWRFIPFVFLFELEGLMDLNHGAGLEEDLPSICTILKP